MLIDQTRWAVATPKITVSTGSKQLVEAISAGSSADLVVDPKERLTAQFHFI